MSDRELERELLAILATRDVRASDLLNEARIRFNADEFAVREAIWRLLTTDQVELTPERVLRPITREPAHA